MKKRKQLVSQYNYNRYSRTPIPYPHHPTMHAIPYFLVGIICGPYRGSFPVRDHLGSNLGIICGPGSFADPYSFLNLELKLEVFPAEFVKQGIDISVIGR